MRRKTQMRALLFYLARYLEADDTRTQRLMDLYQKTTKLKLHRQSLWRQLKLRVSDLPGSTLLVYLTFLSREGAIESTGVKGELFVYAFPELFKSEKPGAKA